MESARVRTVHAEIRGRVQGVGFRWFAREHGRRLRLAGWVRNRPDGSVEVAVCGSDDAVAEFLTALRTGPPGAKVESINEIGEIAAAGDAVGELPDVFTVLR